MSSAAAAGPPPNRHHLEYGGGPTGGSRTLDGGKSVVENGIRGTSRVYPHIDDLVAVKPDINALAPIRKLLVEAESYAKQAETHLDFRRPEIALQDYIKASIIAVDIIPRHKEYTELKADRGDLHRLYMGLQKRINNQHDIFEGVKDHVKENNIRSNVVPRSHIASSSNVVLGTASLSRPGMQEPLLPQGNGNLNGNMALPMRDGDTTRSRAKPPVRPKPDALHGRAIKEHMPTSEPSINPSEADLAARFARLRGAGSHSPTQDPRIRTRLIGMPDIADSIPSQPGPSGDSDSAQMRNDRPLGPRDMPKAPSGPPRPLKIPLDVQILPMPKAPDAVYSPAWNTDDPPNLGMLRSSSRNMYGVAGRSAPVVSAAKPHHPSTRTNGPSNNDLPPYEHVNGDTPKKSGSSDLSDAPSVTPTELFEYLKRGSHELSLLLVDIRSREDFDSGHIMSQSIICIEPIILRKDISAEELAQSLVLSPESEQSLFNTRDTFDLVVYYDQSSTSIEQNTLGSYGEEVSLGDFTKAVYEFGYERRVQRVPKLLVGGLDAWVDLVSPGALVTSETSGSESTLKGGKKCLPLAKIPMARDSRRHYTPRRLTTGARPLTKEEESRWEAAVREEEASLASPDIIRTTEDFLRRFPEASAIQESMSAPIGPVYHGANASQQYDITQAKPATTHFDELPLVPQIPSRPAPALPRQSYSGISEKAIFMQGNTSQAIPLQFRYTDTISQGVVGSGQAGLLNKGNSCYMNSVFQALKGTPLLFTYVQSEPWKSARPPRRRGETTDPPLIMSRHLRNLLGSLMGTSQRVIRPHLIYGYIRKIHENNGMRENNFGDGRQHDAEEFLGFLLEVLEDELNMARDKGSLAVLTSSQEEVRRRLPVIRSSWMEWQRFLHGSDSFITHSFRGQSVFTRTCSYCGFESKSWDTWLTIQLPILEAQSQTLSDTLARRFENSGSLEDYRCESCKAKGNRSTLQEKLSRCPDILIIMFKRGLTDNSGRARKITTQLNFPLDDLDMDRYFISVDGVDSEQLDRTYIKPFKYDCYAVIQHEGRTITSGHYWTLLRDLRKDRKTWTKFSDEQVTTVPAIRTQDSESYVLFYERQK